MRRLPWLLALGLALVGCRSAPLPAAAESDAWIVTSSGSGAPAPIPPRHRWHPGDERFAFRIGSWNMHYLGPSEETPQEPRSAEAFADYIAGSGVSLLAMQEVGHSPGLPRLRNATLDRVFEILRRRGRGDWRYLLFPAHTGDDVLSGVAWNARDVVLAQEPKRLEVESGPLLGAARMPLLPFIRLPVLLDRHPWALKFSTGSGLTDFVVVPVHFHADVDNYLMGDPFAQRRTEASRVASRIDELRRWFHDRDVIVLGDCNTYLPHDDLGDIFGGVGLADANAHDVSTYVPVPAPLDRFFVPSLEPEFPSPPDFFVVSVDGLPDLDFLERYSDHRMIVTRLRVGPDDD